MNNRIDLGPLRPLRVAALGVALSCAGCVYVPPHPYYAYPPPPPPTYGAPVANAAPAPMPTPPNCREFQQTITVNGVLMQNQNNAAGYFLGTNQSGTFMLTAP